MSGAESSGFLSRWSQRKTLARQAGEASLPAEPERPVVAPAKAEPVEAPPPPPAEPPPPTLADVAELTPASADFSRFVAGNVQPEVKNAALKTLFADPHFNVMDGLDTYIDDYSQPSPLPLAMLRKMAQARFLGLVTEEPDESAQAPAAVALPDEDPDLRLQPHDAAGREGPGPGAGEDTRRES